MNVSRMKNINSNHVSADTSGLNVHMSVSPELQLELEAVMFELNLRIETSHYIVKLVQLLCQIDIIFLYVVKFFVQSVHKNWPLCNCRNFCGFFHQHARRASAWMIYWVKKYPADWT